MNEQPSFHSLAFSYLPILVITGILVSRVGSDRIPTRDLADADKYSIADSIAIINAEANLPIYAAREDHSEAMDPAAERKRDVAATDSGMAEEPAATLSVKHDTWQIHIASFTDRNEASRIIQRAGENGINAIKQHVVVNGTQYWRVSVNGPYSFDEAKHHAEQIKDLLGLKDIWLSKDPGE